MIPVSFISGNYVARALNYNGSNNWGEHDRATVALPPRAFGDVARDVMAAGFEAIDVWSGHCSWKDHTPDRLELIKGYVSQYDLAITSYVGRGPEEADDVRTLCRWIKQLGTPLFVGDFPMDLLGDIQRQCGQFDVRFAFENKTETSIDGILERIGGGKHSKIGLALDTGWCGTSGIDALEAVKTLREHISIMHLKDVQAAGAHDTCAIGDGIVPCEQIVRYLDEEGWRGMLCLEHLPFDRDPMPEVQTSVERVKSWMN